MTRNPPWCAWTSRPNNALKKSACPCRCAQANRRATHDFAWGIKWLLNVVHPGAELVRLVLDNLNTHRPAALYETFEPPEARRFTKRLEVRYTPKHGSYVTEYG